jgi:uncharacterized phage protein (TIGR02220 family)
MPIVRVEKNKSFTVMSNIHLRDKDLSWKAKGIMSFMLSLPENWDYSIAGLVACAKDSRDGVRAALKELKDKGYLTTRRVHDSKGRLGDTEYILREQPDTECPVRNKKGDLPNTEKPTLEKPTLDKPTLDKPTLENPPQIITKLTKVLNETNTKEINTLSGNPDGSPEGRAEIISYLNEKAGTHYKSGTPKTVKLIKARMAEGFSLEDFRVVIDKKCADWLTDSEMCHYLRPETLFGNKFEGYLNQPAGSPNKVPYGDRVKYDFERRERERIEREANHDGEDGNTSADHIAKLLSW